MFGRSHVAEVGQQVVVTVVPSNEQNVRFGGSITKSRPH